MNAPLLHDPATVSWYEASARKRIDTLLDAGTFVEFIGPAEREMSPHLAIFDLPKQFDDGMIVGRGTFAGKPVFVAAQEGRFMGGAFGEVHGAKLTGLLRAALRAGPDMRTVLILFDTGGVRLQEANAGELAIAEIMRAVLDARAAGLHVVGLIGGRAGCYGGGGLISGCCSGLAVSESGRISVSGPEVIETNKGVEEFDSKDRALVWRTMGGKNRRLIGVADAFADDTVASFRAATLALLDKPSRFDLDTMKAEQMRLALRLQRFGDCADALDIWAALGIEAPKTIPALPAEDFIAIADAIETNQVITGSKPVQAGLVPAIDAETSRPGPTANPQPPDHDGGQQTLESVLASLFPAGHAVTLDNHGLVLGTGPTEAGLTAHVIGVANKTALGIDEALVLSARVLEIVEAGSKGPLIVLVDSDSQRMSKRDELLGLSDYLAHLAKALILADMRGIATVGLLYGHTAAGAFIATALATRTLVALPGAAPEVMDLPSMARVTKLSLDVLKEKAKTTPVFAPGLDNLAQTGAVLETWTSGVPLAAQLTALLRRDADGDRRDALGKQRGGRPKAADIAARVVERAADHG